MAASSTSRAPLLCSGQDSRLSFHHCGYPALSAALPSCRLFEVHTPEATRGQRRRFLPVGMIAPVVPPSTAPAPAPRPRPRIAPPAAPPAAPIAVFLARRPRRLRFLEVEVLVVFLATAALATGTATPARSPAEIKAARMDFLITKPPLQCHEQDSSHIGGC
jgi:hypothetical protein